MGATNEIVEIRHVPAVVPASGTQVVVPYQGQIVGVTVPTGFQGTALTFENSVNFKSEATGVSGPTPTYQGIYDKAGTQYSVVVAAGHHTIMVPADTAGWGTVRVTSGSTETGTLAARTLVFSVRTV